MNVGASLVDLSSLSTVGALFIAGAAPGTDARKLFNGLLVWGLSMSVVGAALLLGAVRLVTMRVAILDDIHDAWAATPTACAGCASAPTSRIFTTPGQDPAVLRGFDALIANRERTRFTRELLEQLPDVRVIAQTGNHANHIDFAAARELGIVGRTGVGAATRSAPRS